MTLLTFFTIGFLSIGTGAAQAQLSSTDTTISVTPNTMARAVTVRPVVVTASRIAQSLDSVGRSVHIITREQLKAMPVHSVAEALAYVPGVDIQQRGPMGAQADISMRGGGFEQTVVLVNGMRVTDVQTAHNVLALPFTMDDIERIEVVKGGASRVHGPGAMDGVVNIILRDAAATQISATVVGGDFKYREAAVAATLHDNGTTHRLSAQLIQHGNYRQSTDLDLKSVNYQLKTNIGDATLNAFGAVIDKAFGAGLFYPPLPNQWERTVTWLAGTQILAPIDNAWSVSTGALYRANGDEYILDRDNRARYHNEHTTHSGTLNAALHGNSVAGRTTIAVEGGRDVIESSNLGDHHRNRIGSSLEHMIDITPWLQATVGANFMTYSDRSPGVGWGADLVYPYEGGRLFGNVNRSFRPPSYTELFYKDLTSIGDSTLQSETALTYEIGWVHALSTSVDVSFSGFRREQKNGIDYAFPGDSIPQWRATNIQTTIINGFEANIGYRVNHDLPWTAISHLQCGVSFNDASFSSPVPTRYALRQLRWQGVIQTTFALPLNISAMFLVRLFERYSDHVLRTTGDARMQVPIFAVGNGRPSLNLVLEVANIWNAYYIETGFSPVPPRWFRAGISSTFQPL